MIVVKDLLRTAGAFLVMPSANSKNMSSEIKLFEEQQVRCESSHSML